MNAALGSSPLARGLRIVGEIKIRLSRIIPARAGFTMVAGIALALAADHPRSRGVYAQNRPVRISVPGSSPLARGLPLDEVAVIKRHRIIPARAGFTRGECVSHSCPADHPRSRGVYGDLAATEAAEWGSSPLARGLRRRPSGHAAERPDHPRSRGVYRFYRFRDCLPSGSSPLARGLPRHQSHRPRPPRIIPARAGFTC